MENGHAPRKTAPAEGRLPTVNEAIPYSPFSSIVPFNPALIPPFLALPHPSSTAFDNSDDVKAVRKELEQLSLRARTADEASKRCQKTLRDVQKLLNPDNLTQIKFKCTNRSSSTGMEAPQAGKGPVLSSFAKMVYDSTDTPFVRIRAVPAPVKISQPPTNGKVPAPPKVTTASKVAAPSKTPREDVKPVLVEKEPPVKPRSLEAVVQLNTITPEQRKEYQQYTHPPPITPQAPRPLQAPQGLQALQAPQVPQAPSAPQGLFVVPKALTPAQREQYEFIPPSSTPSSAIKAEGGDRNTSILVDRAPKLSADQQRQAQQAVDNLQNQLQSIFEAEDHMQPDTSGETSSHSNALFTVYDMHGASITALHSNVQEALDTAFAKVVKFGRLDDVEVDSLVRAQRICETAISAVPSISLLLNENWTEPDIHEWHGRIASVENGLVAARTMMRIMTGGSHHKEIQSEDNVKAVLYALRWVVDGCVIPIVGERSVRGERVKGEREGPTNQLFVLASQNRPQLQRLVRVVQRCLKLLAELFAKTNVDETSISSAELLCRTLIFGDNAPTEKESALGVSTFELLRRTSMDVVAKLFTKYTGQRQYIIDQILQSLEKLPPTKQNARQFTPIDAKPIQLVSALLMRLVQTSATAGDEMKNRDDSDDDSDDEDASGSDDDEDEADDSDSEGHKKKRKVGRPRKPGRPSKVARDDLAAIAKPLYNAAQSNATEIVRTLLQRALSTSKSSDEPFRKLLDIFTEDFLNVLGSSDWPSAEMLLRKLVGQMFMIAENPKSPAPSRSLALELLGTIGSSILDIRTSTQDYAKSLDSEDVVSKMLAEMTNTLSRGSLDMASLTAYNGPYRVVIEYLYARGDGDAQLQTARGYHLVQWAEHLSSEDVAPAENGGSRGLKRKIVSMIEDPAWLEEDDEFSQITTVQGKLAAKVLTSHLLLCRAFPRILSVLLKSMTSEQSTIRSRALKSVTFLLEKSPHLLDTELHILDSIIRATRDKSSLVRDSAMILIEKCVSLQPSLGAKVNGRVIERTTDASALIRKRAIRFLKQLYLMIKDSDTRALIANAVIVRVADSEESVAEVALSTIEEIWFSGFTEGRTTVDTSIQLKSQVALIIKTVEPSDAVANVLENLVRRISARPKSGSENQQVCQAFVAALFDGVIDSTEIPGSPPQWAILRTLTVFAKAAPRLFTASQLERLEPYAKDLNSQDDLRVFQHVITIFRYTFPHVSSLSHAVLRNLQDSLLKSVQRIPSSELATVAPCLAAIADVLDSTVRLVALAKSALKAVGLRVKVDLKHEPTEARKIERLLYIIGHLGKACDFEPQIASFRDVNQCPGFKGDSVAGYMVSLSCQFTSPKSPLEVRIAALESVCAVCQRCPSLFLRADVTTAFKAVFADHIPSLEHVLLTSIADFFSAQETPEDDVNLPQLGSGIESGTERLGNTYQATGLDSAFGVLAQTFLDDFLRIALSSQDEVATAAARIVVSINRQGRATPRQSGYCLVALETCPNLNIAKMAFLEHKSQYSKHEGTFESDLPRSLEKTFKYQLNLTDEVTGYSGQPPVSKLHFLWEVLKTGKAKVRTKLFTSMCSKIAFDPNTFVPSKPMPERLLSARFSVEAMAFLEFDRVEELNHLLSSLEKTFSTTGTPVAQAIESEVQQLNVQNNASASADLAEPTNDAMDTVVALTTTKIEPGRLLQLAVFAQILSLLFETHSFLRRVWNVKNTAVKAKKSTTKDNAAKPTRAVNHAALTEAYQNRVNDIMKVAPTDAEQRAICNSFAETFKRDDEVKVGSDEDEDVDMDDHDDACSVSSSGKSGSAPLGTPRKRKRHSSISGDGPPKKRGRPPKISVDEEDEDPEGDWD